MQKISKGKQIKQKKLEEGRRNGFKILKTISIYVLLYLLKNISELRIVWIIIKERKLIDFK